MRNFKMILEYDGTAYCGWQRQDNGVSIQKVLEEAIESITREKSVVIASGRTDAGVHAMNQVASFKSGTRLPVHRMFLGTNSVLPEDIVIKDLQEVSLEFNALKDALGKVYVYKILNQRLRPALGRHYFWFVRFFLNIEHMRQAASYLIGEHDFNCFCATGCDIKNRVRTLSAITISVEEEGMLEITVESGGFLRHMVRNIVGTLVDVGRGKLKPEDMREIIESRDRKNAGVAAPAYGLFLKEVKYSK